MYSLFFSGSLSNKDVATEEELSGKAEQLAFFNASDKRQ